MATNRLSKLTNEEELARVMADTFADHYRQVAAGLASTPAATTTTAGATPGASTGGLISQVPAVAWIGGAAVAALLLLRR